MYIHKSVYEILPYLYIAIGIAIYTGVTLFSEVTIFAFFDSSLIYLSTALLYAAGSLVWVARSAYRRKNSKNHIENRKGLIRFPEPVYEYLPFVYLALGLVLVSQVPGFYGVIPGAILCLAGVLVWMIRAIYRSHEESSVGA